MNETDAIVLLPRLRVRNANAVSGPLSWGFPPPTAFTGFVHALERRLRSVMEVRFGGVGIVCHNFAPQVASGRPRKFSLSRNPLGRDGSSAALVEEGRAHMEVSLLIELLTELDRDEQDELLNVLMPQVHSLRLAGGSILPRFEPHHRPAIHDWFWDDADNVVQFRKLRRRLLPGFALVERDDLLHAHLQTLRKRDSRSDAIDALLDLSRLNFEPLGEDPKTPGKIQWGAIPKLGWLVPLPVGYAALTSLIPAGEVINARDRYTPFRFVESLYSLGEWLSPHRLSDPQALFWRHTADTDAGIYRCSNHYAQIAHRA